MTEELDDETDMELPSFWSLFVRVFVFVLDRWPVIEDLRLWDERECFDRVCVLETLFVSGGIVEESEDGPAEALEDDSAELLEEDESNVLEASDSEESAFDDPEVKLPVPNDCWVEELDPTVSVTEGFVFEDFVLEGLVFVPDAIDDSDEDTLVLDVRTLEVWVSRLCVIKGSDSENVELEVLELDDSALALPGASVGTELPEVLGMSLDNVELEESELEDSILALSEAPLGSKIPEALGGPKVCFAVES